MGLATLWVVVEMTGLAAYTAAPTCKGGLPVGRRRHRRVRVGGAPPKEHPTEEND